MLHDKLNFCLVAPEAFTTEQKQLVDKFREMVCFISAQTDIIIGAKDIYSRHLIRYSWSASPAM
jgi:hypothetical protein